MAILVTDSGGGDHEPIPEDQHVARCVLVADIGTQDTPWGAKRQCIIGFEIPSVRRVFDEDEGEKPAMISGFYTLSLNEKATLRHDLESWRGKSFTPEELAGFDIEKLAGVPCLIQVIHKEKKEGGKVAKIGAISKLPAAMTAPDAENQITIYSVDDHNGEIFDTLPEWIQKTINASTQFAVRAKQGAENAERAPDMGAEIPF